MVFRADVGYVSFNFNAIVEFLDVWSCCICTLEEVKLALTGRFSSSSFSYILANIFLGHKELGAQVIFSNKFMVDYS